MRARYFDKAQELSRLALLTGNNVIWQQAMQILRRAIQ